MGNCSCGGTRLLFACSGRADIGELADKVARNINESGKAKMYCLAGIGAGLPAFVESAKGACGTVTIDGCGIGCAKKTLENIGLNPKTFVLIDMGYEKGKTSVFGEVVGNIQNLCTRSWAHV